MPIKLIGTEPYQVPRNSDLGTMAYQDAENYNTKLTPNVVSVNSSDTALRITQTGTGNALVVEDSDNPDSTPFVIDTDGRVISGSATYQGYAGAAPYLQVNNTGASTSAIGVSRWVASAVAGQLQLAKSRGAAVGTRGIVSSGDDFGSLTWAGDDGTNFVLGASIAAQVDGTPGTNDMPGRLVFSTTADGASSPTERLRIDSAGKVTIGASGTGSTQVALYVRSVGDYAGANYGVYARQNLLSSTTGYYAFNTEPTITSGATITTLAHYQANSGTFNSTPTNQYGFYATSSLTGASNNYGFYSNIAAGTGRWNFYAVGTASNYFAGLIRLGSPDALGSAMNFQLQIGGTSSSDPGIGIAKFATSGTSVVALARSRNTTTSTGVIVQNGDVLGQIAFLGDDGSSWKNSAQIIAEVDGTPGTNDMPGRLVFSTTSDGASSPTERMRIDSAGRVGFSILPSANSGIIRFGNNATGSTTIRGIVNDMTVQSDVTTSFSSFRSQAGTAAASFTLGHMSHFIVDPGTFGADSTVTNQYGFYATSSLTGATNNYGFYSSIPASTGDWNFYANGTAQNYFAGNTSIGALPSGSNKFEVTGDSKLTGALWVTGAFEQSQQAVAALDIDCSVGNFFTKTIAADSTFTFSNVPASGIAYAMTIEITHTSGTITWPTSVKWNNDRAPALTTGKTHLFTFVTYNGGTRWRASALVDYVN